MVIWTRGKRYFRDIRSIEYAQPKFKIDQQAKSESAKGEEVDEFAPIVDAKPAAATDATDAEANA